MLVAGIVLLERGAFFFGGAFFLEVWSMPKKLPPGASYAGRRPDVMVLNTSLEYDAGMILRKYCPEGRRTTGRFLSRLLYQFEERQQVLQHVKQFVDGDEQR